jgi:hypothetical protein
MTDPARAEFGMRPAAFKRQPLPLCSAKFELDLTRPNMSLKKSDKEKYVTTS